MSIVEGRDVAPGPVRAAVAVIGSGPAGMTVARELARAGTDVVVLESGGYEPEAGSRRLSDGEVEGQPFVFERLPFGLADVRMRVLGGTSGHWAGMCMPLEPIDLRARPAVERGGWPIDGAELAPWYRMAQATCQIGDEPFDPHAWYDAEGGSMPLDGDVATTSVYLFSPPTRFGTTYRGELERSARCTVLLHTTVVELEPSADGGHVQRIHAIAGDDDALTVEAEVVVVATGEIDVPRLLLLSRAASPAGLANRSGLVGRGFMEHPHVRVGRLAVDADVAELLHSHTGSGAYRDHLGWPCLRLTDAACEERGLLNAALTLDDDHHQAAPAGEELGPGIAELLAAGGRRPHLGSATLRTEQRAVSAHEVRLGTRRDALGLPLPEVRWTVDDGTLASIVGTIRALAEAIGASGLGRLELAPGGGPLRRDAIEIGCHHMGTARMSEDPSQGVVDRDGRCHDVDNLYLAGSAVFPTSGFANPTLTIVALAHRLAATIGARLA